MFLFLNTWAQWVQMGDSVSGEFPSDEWGSSVAMSADGLTFIAGGSGYDGNNGILVGSGYARVMTWNGTQWQQKGQSIEGDFETDYAGRSVAINAVGNIIAISSLKTGASQLAGRARVFEWNEVNQIWEQKGQSIDSQTEIYHLALNASGNVIALGEPYNYTNGTNAGQAMVYAFSNNQWEAKGEVFAGSLYDFMGFSVDLDATGDVFVVGAPHYYALGLENDFGKVLVYHWNETEWLPVGDTISRNIVNGASGSSVSLSYDGMRLAYGSINIAIGGNINVVEWNGSDWLAVGDTIESQQESESLGQSVDLSADGQLLAVGSKQNSEIELYAGKATLYRLLNGIWNIETSYNGTNVYESYGSDVALDSSGHYFAVGSTEGFDNRSGSVWVYYSETTSASEVTKLTQAPLVYPNPANKQIEIKTHQNEIIKLRIYDISGRKVYDSPYLNRAIDVRSWPRGIYQVHLQSQNLSNTTLLILE